MAHDHSAGRIEYKNLRQGERPVPWITGLTEEGKEVPGVSQDSFFPHPQSWCRCFHPEGNDRGRSISSELDIGA